MRKVFLSGFALSLVLMTNLISAQIDGVDDFIGLESELMPELTGPQEFTSKEFHDQPNWRVEAEQVLIDEGAPNKGQTHSIIPWSTLDPNDWLSIDGWLTNRIVKDQNPNWKIRLRQTYHRELMGKMLSCSGECWNYRGESPAKVQYLSQILEGDELRTEKDSVAWIFLMDGSLLRLSPQTSVSFYEINLSKHEFFLNVRLNQGFVSWHPREKDNLPINFDPETDTYSLPLKLREANVEYFEQKIYRSQNDHQQLNELTNFQKKAIEAQFKKINELKESNNSRTFLSSRFVLISPQGSIISKSTPFSVFHLMGNKTYFKRNHFDSVGSLQLELRGYLSSDLQEVQDSGWYEIPFNGRSFNQVSDPPATLQILDLLVKRIKTIELAREMWIDQFTINLTKNLTSPDILAVESGYTLLSDEYEKRISFILEYSRRIETTNLKSIENLMLKLEKNGEFPRKELSEDYYSASINHYLLGLKYRLSNQRQRVRKLSDLEFYVWTLKNGKF